MKHRPSRRAFSRYHGGVSSAQRGDPETEPAERLRADPEGWKWDLWGRVQGTTVDRMTPPVIMSGVVVIHVKMCTTRVHSRVDG